MRLPLLLAMTMTAATMASAQTVAPPPPAAAPAPSANADPAGNGVVTKAEWQARSAARFDRLDTNHDGTLDATERAAMRDRRRPPGGRPPAPADY
ncbi:hypothetical protein ACT009_00850 [Sphingomonas sp. Tas61C01]|uniref:hypothetical protein n=1 Tax=Sphingomonas sp. Tas61C01 TaxID=3458297 RepID=UPI00403E4362